MEIAGFRSKYSDEQIEALLDAAANGGGGGGSEIVYFATDLESAIEFLLACGKYLINCRCENGSTVMINSGVSYATENPSQLRAIAVSKSPIKTIIRYGSTVYENEKVYSNDEVFKHFMSDGGLWEITESEYYDLNFDIYA